MRARPVLHPEEEFRHLDGLLSEQDQSERADHLEDRQGDQNDTRYLRGNFFFKTTNFENVIFSDHQFFIRGRQPVG